MRDDLDGTAHTRRVIELDTMSDASQAEAEKRLALLTPPPDRAPDLLDYYLVCHVPVP